MGVDCEPYLRRILRDEALTRGLGDIEARMLVEWVVQWAELFAQASQSREEADTLIFGMSRRGRAIGRFVTLWCDFAPTSRGAAGQLAASERFQWPLPTSMMDAPDLMRRILDWENQHHE